MMKKVIAACLFCLLVTGGVSFGDGYRVMRSIVPGTEGTEYASYSTTVCSDSIVCDGNKVIDVDLNGKFVLCWGTNNAQLSCESGPIDAPLVPGNHYFTIVGFVDDQETTYQRWDEDSQSYVETTYTIPGYTTPPSNEAVLIVSDVVIPPEPPSGGCSIRRYLP